MHKQPGCPTTRRSFMYLGKLIEFVPTSQVFKTPTHELTESHVIPASHEIWTLGRASRLDEPLRSTAHPEDSPYLEQSISLGRLV